jgi:preprotein translocase subunit SecG
MLKHSVQPVMSQMAVLKGSEIVVTNVMHKFLTYLSVYFCLTCFGLSFSPSSEAGVQFGEWFKSSGYGVSARAEIVHLPLKIG